MKSSPGLSPRDLRSLSAYLDNALSPRQAAKLEARLREEEQLRQELESLRATVGLLRALPEVEPPRSFTLSPEMVGLRQRRSAYPALRLATVLAVAAFVSLIGVDAFTRGFGGASYSMRSEESQEIVVGIEEAEAPVEGMAAAPAVEEEQGEAQPAAEMEGLVGEEALEAPKEPAVQPTMVPSGTPQVGVQRQEAPPCADCAADALEATPTEEARMATLAPTATLVPATPADKAIHPSDVTGQVERIPPLRLFEISLGAVVVLLLVLTLRARRRD